MAEERQKGRVIHVGSSKDPGFAVIHAGAELPKMSLNEKGRPVFERPGKVFLAGSGDSDGPLHVGAEVDFVERPSFRGLELRATDIRGAKIPYNADPLLMTDGFVLGWAAGQSYGWVSGSVGGNNGRKCFLAADICDKGDMPRANERIKFFAVEEPGRANPRVLAISRRETSSAATNHQFNILRDDIAKLKQQQEATNNNLTGLTETVATHEKRLNKNEEVLAGIRADGKATHNKLDRMMMALCPQIAGQSGGGDEEDGAEQGDLSKRLKKSNSIVGTDGEAATQGAVAMNYISKYSNVTSGATTVCASAVRFRALSDASTAPSASMNNGVDGFACSFDSEDEDGFSDGGGDCLPAPSVGQPAVLGCCAPPPGRTTMNAMELVKQHVCAAPHDGKPAMGPASAQVKCPAGSSSVNNGYDQNASSIVGGCVANGAGLRSASGPSGEGAGSHRSQPREKRMKVMTVNAKGVAVGSDNFNVFLTTIHSYCLSAGVAAVLISEVNYVKEQAGAVAGGGGLDGGGGPGGDVVDDNVSSFGAPLVIRRPGFTFITSTEPVGVGVLLVSGLVGEFDHLCALRGLDGVVRVRQRAMRVVLKDVVLVSVCAPSNATKKRFAFFTRQVESCVGCLLAPDKWKMVLCAGDANCQLGVDSRTPKTVGEHTLQNTSSAGAWFLRWLTTRNLVLATSFHPRRQRVTYKDQTEIDHFLCKQRDSHRVVGFDTVSQSDFDRAVDADGSLGDCGRFKFDHCGVVGTWSVRSFAECCDRAKTRKGAKSVFMKVLPADVSEALNDEFAKSAFDVDSAVAILASRVGQFKAKVHVDPPAVVDNDGSRSAHVNTKNVWGFINGNKRSAVSVKKVGLPTPEAFAKKYESVGNDPVPSGQLSLDEVFGSGVVDPFSPEQIGFFDAPITSDELRAAVRAESGGGRVVDSSGIVMRVLGYLSEPNFNMLTAFVNAAVADGTMGATPATSDCNCCEMFKAGSHKEVNDYRFLTITPVITKAVERIFVARLTVMAEAPSPGPHPAEQFGFRPGLGCAYSLTVLHRLQEDLCDYDCPLFNSVYVTLADLKKAFPSFDARAAVAGAKALGIHATRAWGALHRSHRSARYRFRGLRSYFCNRHGFKEGACSSPLLFALCYGIAMKFYKKVRGEAGVVLRADPSRPWNPRVSREELVAALQDGSCGSYFHRLMLLLFADDTTLVENVTALEKALLSGQNAPATPGMLALLSVLRKIGTRENPDKRKVGTALRIRARNLGCNTNRRVETKLRIRKSWGVYHGVSANLVSVRVQRLKKADRGRVISAATRSCMLYATEARGVSSREANELKIADDDQVLRISGRHRWHLHAFSIRMGWLRYGLQLPPVLTLMNYRKCAFYGHVVRADGANKSLALAKASLCGRFYPGVENGGSGVAISESEKALCTCNAAEWHHERPVVPATIRGNVDDWLIGHCGVLPELVPLLTLNNRIAKCLFYLCTRERYISECLSDWFPNDDGSAERCESLEGLCDKYNVNNYKLNTAHVLYSANCVFCNPAVGLGK
eukprot:gene249-367_t